MKKIILFLMISLNVFAQNYIIRQDSLRASEAQTKNILRLDIRDSLNANVRGWQTAQQVANQITDSLNTNARGWQTAQQVANRITDSLNANARGWQTAQQVSGMITDSLNANARGWQTAQQVSNRITDSLNTNARGWQTAQQVANQITDTLNANSRGWRTQAQAKADAIDTLSALPTGSDPSIDNYVIGETGTGLRKFVLDDIPMSSAVNQNFTNYATSARTDYLESLIDSLRQEVDRLKTYLDSLGAVGNPFPVSPSNLIASGGDGIISLSWTPSTSVHTSQVIFYKRINQDIDYLQLAVIPQGATNYTHSGLGYSETYSYYVKAVKDSIYSSASNIATATTNSQVSGGFAPDLVGILKGNSVGDFSYSAVEGNNTVSVDTGWYKIYFDSTQTFHETAYLQKTFIAQNDSVFTGAYIYISDTLHTWATASRIMLFSLIDTVSGSTIAMFGINTDANRLPVSWRLSSKNGGSTTTTTSSTAFGKGFIRLQIAVKTGVSGSVSYYKNDTLVATHNVDLSGVSINAVVIGQTSFIGSNEPVKSAIWFDNIYVDSRSKQVGNWWEDSYQSGEGENGWFVNKNATGLNNGTSWDNAWTSFASINWANILPGDTLYISGGNDSTVYNETLVLNKDGTSTNPIVITKGKTSGHNGKVIIDGQGVRTFCIQSEYNASDYVIIENLTLRNAIGNNIRMRSDYVTVKNCSLYVSSGATSAISYRTSKNCIFENNYVWTSDNVGNGNGDGIQIDGYGGTTNITIRNNTFIMNNQNVDDHCDAIQAYSMPYGNLNIYNNYILLNNDKRSNSQGIYLNTVGGVMKVYNNVIINRSNSNLNGMITIKEVTSSYDLDTILVYNNSILCFGFGYGLNIDASLNADALCYTEVKNNTVLHLDSARAIYTTNIGIPIFIKTPQTPIIDYNVWYDDKAGTTTKVLSYAGVSRSFTEWQGLGFDTNGYMVKPDYNSIVKYSENLMPVNLGNLHNKGTSIGLFNIDILNITRPQGGTWDIGAYEYVP